MHCHLQRGRKQPSSSNDRGRVAIATHPVLRSRGCRGRRVCRPWYQVSRRVPTSVWQYGDMGKVKTTLSIDERLMRQVRVRAARIWRRDSEVLEAALREGL